MEDVHGKIVPGVVIDGHPYELILISGWDFNPPPRWYRLPQWLKSHLTRASGILRGNITTNDWDSEHDDDRFLDLNQFVSALFAELPEARMKVTDLMHMGKLDNKNRFEFLAVAGHQKATGINQTYWPMKIRAAAGHNNMFIRSENDLFFNADVVYVRHQDAGRDLSNFRDTGVPVMENIDDVPAMAFHRTFHAAIKGIQQDGLLVGGGARRNSGRAHIYLARHQIRQNEVVPGNRRLNPIEVVVALREAVADGLICFTTKAGAILSPYNISSAYIVHIRDTEKDIILWSRSNATKVIPKAPPASREGVPTTAPAASSSGSTDVAMEPVPTQKRERPAAEEPEAEEDVEIITPEPPQEAQRDNIPTEEVMCPGCGANLVSGTIVCPACNTNITGTSEVKRGILAKRKELLNKLGYKYLDADTIERMGSQSKQFREEHARGNRSPEGDYIGVARQQLKRAMGLGYTSMADRYENDVQFVERMTEHNITMLDIQLRDIVAHGHLPMPPRARAQVDLGVGMRTANDLDFAKLMYVDEDIADITSSDPGLLERFEHSHWVIIWKRELYSLKEFQDLCDHRKTRGKGTNLLTFTCVMEIIEAPTLRELHETIDSSLPVAQQLVQNKREQSERAAERNAAKGRGKASRAHVAAPRTPPKADPAKG